MIKYSDGIAICHHVSIRHSLRNAYSVPRKMVSFSEKTDSLFRLPKCYGFIRFFPQTTAIHPITCFASNLVTVVVSHCRLYVLTRTSIFRKSESSLYSTLHLISVIYLFFPLCYESYVTVLPQFVLIYSRRICNC